MTVVVIYTGCVAMCFKGHSNIKINNITWIQADYTGYNHESYRVAAQHQYDICKIFINLR